MALADIRAAVVDRAKTVVLLKDVLPLPPEQAPQVTPVAWLGDTTIDIGQGGTEVEVWNYTLRLVVAVAPRKGFYPAEAAPVDAIIDALIAAFRGGATLGGQVYGFRYGQITSGSLDFSEPNQFVGIILPLLLKEKRNVTYTP